MSNNYLFKTHRFIDKEFNNKAYTTGLFCVYEGNVVGVSLKFLWSSYGVHTEFLLSSIGTTSGEGRDNVGGRSGEGRDNVGRALYLSRPKIATQVN